MEDKISVIVPIYNVEKYLTDCVMSLLHQDYNNFEILLIDDGSTDSSGSIADKLANNSTKVLSYHKINGGLSDARNYGIDKATGEYVCFVDSDDIVEKDYLSSMMRNINENNTLIAACGICRFYDDGKKEYIVKPNIARIFDGVEAQKYLNIDGYFNVSACNKLFKKDLFSNIRFPIGKRSEDWRVMYLLLEKAKSIFYDSTEKYLYRQRMGSITKNAKVNTESIEAARAVLHYYEEKQWIDAIPYAVQSLILAIIGVYNAYFCINKKSKELKGLHKEVKKIFGKITFDELKKSRSIQIILFVYFLPLYNIAFSLFDKRRKKKHA